MLLLLLRAGAVTIQPSLVTNSNSIFAPTITAIILPPLLVNDNTFFGSSVALDLGCWVTLERRRRGR